MNHTHSRSDSPTAATARADIGTQVKTAWRHLRAAFTSGFVALLLTACGGGHGSSSSIAVTTGNPTLTTNLTSIEVGPPDATVPAGLVHQFTATGIYSDGSKLDLSTSVVWTSSAPATATISNVASSTGLVTTHSPGTTTLTATLGSQSGATTLTVSGATLTTIGVTPANASLAIGGRLPFLATGIYSDKTTADLTHTVTWSSSTPAAATISNTAATAGVAAGIAAGPTLITATLGALTASTPLTVTGTTLVALTVTPATPTVANGVNEQFTATAFFSDNSVQNVTALATWSSSDSTTATVSNTAGSNGVATTLKVGTVTISATYGTVTNSTLLTVSAATLATLTVTPANISLPNGSTRAFIATGTYTDGSSQPLTTTVIWSSSNTAAATISNAAGFEGVAKGTGLGTTTITATAGAGAGVTVGSASGITASTPLTVSAATLVSIGVTPANTTVAKGSQVQYTATGIYTDNTTQDLTRSVAWESSTLAATISNVAATQNTPGTQGLAAAAGIGTTVISATRAAVPGAGAGAGGAAGTPAVTGSTNLTVTAATLVSLAINTASATVAQGTPAVFTATGTYSDGSTQDLTTAVTWTSGTLATATISNTAPTNGLATTHAAGTTLITAALGPVNTTPGLTLTVTPATLASIAITAPRGATTLPTGATLQLTAIGTYSDGTTHDLTNSATWTTSNAGVIAITNSPGIIPPGTTGVVTGGTPGTATLSASYPGAPGGPSVSGTLQLTATAAVVASITVTPANASVRAGATRQFTATGTYTDGTSQDITTDVTWSATAPTTTPIATISNAPATQTAPSSQGLATGVAVGSATITATDPVTGVAGSTTLTVTHTGYAYATNFGYSPNDNTVSQYTVGVNGALMPLITAAAPNGTVTTGGTNGNNPFAIVVDPTGHYAYTANYDFQNGTTPSTVSQFTISQTDGSLTPLTTTAAPGGTVAAGVQPNGITADPRGRAVYVANYGDGSVSQYFISHNVPGVPDGSLTPMTPASVQSGAGAANITVDATGSYAYVTNFSAGNIAQFTINADGSLSAMPTLVNDLPNSGPNTLVIDPTGKYLYVANLYGGNVVQYTLNPVDGSLGAITATTPTGNYPRSIAITPNDAFLYVPNGNDDTLSAFTIGSGGALTLLATISNGAGTQPNSITIDPSGAYAYVTDRGTRNPYVPGTTVSQYTIGADGSLTPMTSPTVASGRAPSSIAVIN